MAGGTKLYNDSVKKRTGPLVALTAVSLVAAIFMQNQIDPNVKEMRKGEENFIQGTGSLNNEFLLLPLLGFREAAAGLLWVRCDEFFHSGDYDAILPLVRLITWLDPHADNVYITGAWHLAYNFTDSSERSDRRYLGPSQALLTEGIRNNMKIPDIKFEKGWQNYDKIKDFKAAAAAFQLALDTESVKGVSEDYPYGAPLKTNHILAHTYEKMGRLPDAIAEWDKALERSAAQIKLNPNPTDGGTQNTFSINMLRSAEERNRAGNLQRWRDRYTAEGHDPKINPTNHPGILGIRAGDPARLWNVSFRPKVEVVRPRVLKVGGLANMADGGRIDVRLTDWDYKERNLGGEKLERFDVDPNQTILIDQLAVRKNKFERELDMSKDPKMYGFASASYRLTLSFNTRITSPHIQDRFGYSGEGLTTDNPAYLVYDKRTDLLGTKMVEGQGGEGPLWDGKTAPWAQYGQPVRLIRVTYKLSREQMLGQKPITDADIVPNEEIK